MNNRFFCLVFISTICTHGTYAMSNHKTYVMSKAEALRQALQTVQNTKEKLYDDAFFQGLSAQIKSSLQKQPDDPFCFVQLQPGDSFDKVEFPRDIKNKTGGWNLAHLAAVLVDVKLMSDVLNAGIDPNKKDNMHETPLHKVAKSFNKLDQIKMIKLLKSKKADVTITNKVKERPLDYFLIYGKTSVDTTSATFLLLPVDYRKDMS